jgi:protein ImuB
MTMLACVWLPTGTTAQTGGWVRKLFMVSPLVERSGSDDDPLAFLDVRGLSRLHGGAAGLFAAIRTALAPDEPRGLALAANRFTAEVAARHVPRAVWVAPGEEAQFLAHLPLSALPMSASLARRLAPLGLKSLGDFASLPCTSIERRYGPEGVSLHRLARGEDTSVLVPCPEPRRRAVMAGFEPPAEGLERVEPVLVASMEQLMAALRERGRGVSRLRLVLRLVDGRTVSREIAPATAEERSALLVDLLRLKLQSDPPPGPVTDLELEVVEDHALAVHQNALFGEVARDASRRAEALSRLKALLGEQVVAPPRPRRAHRLEQRWQFDEGAQARSRQSQAAAPSARSGGAALRLLPEPEVLVPVRAGGRTVAFRRGRRTLEVTGVEGPRRLTGGWWSRAYERDEYDVQTSDGGVYRVCRDRRSRRWLLLGEMD